MKKTLPLTGFIAAFILLSGLLFFRNMEKEKLEHIVGIKQGGEEDDEDAVRTENPYGRSLYEYNLMKDPATGSVPAGLLSRQKIIARAIPFRNAFARGSLNTYLPAGPDNIGGRTRCVEYDVRYNGGSNQVLLAGGVSGGIFKSTDGGATWQWKATLMINSITTIAQDPRPGHQDTWYCGTGEFVPTSYISGPPGGSVSSFIVGWGLFVSKDNGETWLPMSFSNSGATGGNNPYQFDNAYDIINKIAVNPVNGDLYVSRYGSIIRVTPLADGTSYTRQSALSPAYGFGTGLNTSNQISDVVCSGDGNTIYAAFHGEDTAKADADISKSLEGVWKGSVNGITGQVSWVKIAGGDLHAPAGWSAGLDYGRVVMALSSDNNSLYVMYDNHQNGRTNATGGAKAEADLFRYSAVSNTWVNLSANVPVQDKSNRGAFQVQAGYDMAVAVSPSGPDTVFIGGINAFRSTDGFATANNITLINGYGRKGIDNFAYGDVNGDSRMGHPDMHWFAFRPGGGSEMICSNDGGMQLTGNAYQADSLSWKSLNSNYQTLQYYYVAIDPTSSQLTFGGGAQDNHCTLRNSFNSDPNAHDLYEVGDGCAVAISALNSNNLKFFYISSENGPLYRVGLSAGNNYTGSFAAIKPAKAQGDFITYFLLDPDNTENLYFASNDSLYKTNNASTVSSGTWTLLKGIKSLNGGDIRSMATTRGAYNAKHNLFIGTDKGKILRLKDPVNADSSSVPVDITPTGMSGVVIGMAANPRNDDTLMAVVSNFNVPGIWWTGNANAAIPVWQSCEGNLDSLSARSCAIVDKQSGVEYYVGTSAGLYSATAISGTNTSWVHEGSGALAYAVVSSMALRWNDNTLVVGTHGNGMYYAAIGSPVPVGDTTVTPPAGNPVFIQSIYPAVFQSNLNIRVGNMTTVNKIFVTVYNMIGQRMYSNELSYQDAAVDLSYLPGGLYIIHIISDDQKNTFTRKFIKQ